MLLEIKDVSKKYTTLDGEVTALERVSFSVGAGEFVAIVGSSGSGKTTLLNMLGALDTCDSGSIVFDGLELSSLSDKRSAELRRKRIGIIYQFYNLIPELRVSENIILPTELDGREPDIEWLFQILKIVGLEGRENSYPNILSGGQQQRVAIARALFGKPELLLADEPTRNLDAENSREILKLLEYMNNELGTTIIVVTHSDSVANAAGRVITVENGRITSDRRKV